MDENKKIVVKSKYNGYASFKPNGTQVSVVWPKSGTVQVLEFKVIRDLYNSAGGEEFINGALLLPEDVVKELGMNAEPEYFYDKETIEEMLEKGTVEQIIDAINFGGSGTAALIKDCAIDGGISDLAKIDAISKEMNIDLLGMIKIHSELKEEEETKNEKTRLSKSYVKKDEDKKEEVAPTRRTYKRV